MLLATVRAVAAGTALMIRTAKEADAAQISPGGFATAVAGAMLAVIANSDGLRRAFRCERGRSRDAAAPSCRDDGRHWVDGPRCHAACADRDRCGGLHLRTRDRAWACRRADAMASSRTQVQRRAPHRDGRAARGCDAGAPNERVFRCEWGDRREPSARRERRAHCERDARRGRDDWRGRRVCAACWGRFGHRPADGHGCHRGHRRGGGRRCASR